ncbi:MAG: sensor domain-containing diguanylate cyclase [Thermoleophilia bacterium]
MKIGYGRNRIIWYIVFGGAAGAFLAGAHSVLQYYFPVYHYYILLLLIPILAGVMALLAMRENAIFEWGDRMDRTRLRVNDLMQGAIIRKTRTPEFQDPSLATCWQRLGCDQAECPAYGLEHTRCWLIAGTFCRGQVQGKFARKLKDCRLCEVYQAAAADPVQEITENFYAMNYLLGEREDQLEKAYSAARVRGEKLAGLVSLSEAALSTVHLSELMQNLLESAASFVGADFGVVSLADASGENLSVRVSYGLPLADSAKLSTKAGEGIIGQAFAGRYIAVSEDLSTDSRVTNLYLRSLNARTMISLPLVSREQLLGMLTLCTFTPHQYTEEEKDSLIVAADRIAVAIENSQLTGELGRDREQFELMEAITSDASTGDGVNGVYDSFISHARGLLDFDQASLALWHPEENEVEIVALKTEAARSWMGEGLRLPKDALPVGKVIDSRSPLIRDEILGNEYPTDKLLIEEGIRSAVFFPLVSKGEVLGTMNLGSFKPAAFSVGDVELLEPVTRQLGLVLDNARMLQDARHHSVTDALTGLHNHRFFVEALGREVARSSIFNRPVTLVVVDVDDFKPFNDRYGQPVGDRTINQISGLLKQEIREIDIIARSGGDEFAILLPETGVVSAAAPNVRAMDVADRIRALAKEITLPEGASPMTFSLGLAEYPSQANGASQLLEHANWALREAKARGKDRVVVAPPLKARGADVVGA